MEPTLKVGDTLPIGTFKHVPWSPELEDNLICGVPQLISTDEWKGKKVVLFSVTGAFTPTCHVQHLPGFIEHYDEFKAKGVDIVAVIAANDVYVMSAWGRVEGVKDKILTLTDVDAKWSGSLGLSADRSESGMGIRTARYAMAIDDLVVKYIGVEPQRELTVTSAEAVLSSL